MIPDLSVEYLIVTKADGGFCSNVETFNSLLCADADIKIRGKSLSYKGLTVSYEARSDILLEKQQRYFYIKLDCEDAERIEDFAMMLKAVRTMAHKTGGDVAVVWDDIAFYYATQAYPLIHKIENLLRKLIVRFMYTSVGLDWGDTTLPNELRDSISRAKRDRQGGASLLHETDFIQLADYLFRPYQSPTSGNELIQERIAKAKTADDLDIEELKSYVPRSNWSRYFADRVDCDDTFLNKRWQRLYKLRNLIAHNNIVTKRDYEEILQLVDEVQKPIQDAINNLDTLSIPEEEKETIAENFAVNRGPLYGEFILLWTQIESELIRIQNAISNQSQPGKFRGPLSAINELRRAQLIDTDQYESLNRLREVRNMVVHHSASSIDEDNLVKAILGAEMELDKLRNIASN